MKRPPSISVKRFVALGFEIILKEVNPIVLEPVTKSHWQRFVQEGVLDSSRISKRIANSWYHCKQKGVDPYSGTGIQLLSYDELQQRQKNHRRLLQLADPLLKKLSKMYNDSKFVFLLTDREGYVLRMIGWKDIKAFARKINFVEGVKWTEEQVGTNAIGTALSIGEPISIKGAEHFSVASQDWVCYASPLRDEEGELMGTLDISSPHSLGNHEYLLGTVVSTAYTIEQKWQKMMKEDELALLRYGLSMEKESPYPFILCDRKDRITYASPTIANQVSGTRKLPVDSKMSRKKRIPVYAEGTPDIIGYRIPWSKQQGSSSLRRKTQHFSFQGIKGTSSSFQKVIQKAERASQSKISVHISGETGTGKEIMARSLHDSVTPNAPFVTLNCGAMPEDLLEGELFGYVPGAFTGAQKGGYDGKIAQANGGTLFLDEIGDISPASQVALLRVLQERCVVPIGGKKAVPTSFRLITATNKSLSQLVRDGTFREDLYYRIYVYPLHIPPLRERPEDLSDLVGYFFQKQQWEFHWKKEAIQELQRYHWPGNIRELFNVLEGLYLEYGDDSPSPEQIESYIHLISPSEENKQRTDTLSHREQMEKEWIEKALRQHGGHVSSVSKQLGIPRSTLYRKLKKYKLNR